MKLAPIIFAAAVAGVTWWRRHQLGWPLRAAAAALCAALAISGAGIIRLPQLETAVGTIGSTLGPYTYPLVAVMAFLETGAFIGLLVPGETVVINAFGLLALTWCCALAGDTTGYLLGRRLGRRFLIEHGSRVGITEPRLRQVETFFARYGLATILIGRFVGFVRPIAPFLAGASRYPRGRFLGLAVIGTGLWSATFVLLGFMFWQSFGEAVAIAKRGSLALGGVIALVVAAVLAYRYLRRRAGGARRARGSLQQSAPFDRDRSAAPRRDAHDAPERQAPMRTKRPTLASGRQSSLDSS
jgi:undecaprenyl-diphosphatase